MRALWGLEPVHPPTGSRLGSSQTGASKPMPVWQLVLSAYRLTWQLLPEFWQISWRWLLVLLAATWLFNWHLWPVSQWSKSAQLEFLDPANFISMIVPTLATAPISFAWFRLLLLDERPSPGSHLRFDGAVLAYYVKAQVLVVLASAPLVVFEQLLNYLETDIVSVLISVVLIIAAFGLILMILAPLNLALPSAATDGPLVDLGDAWRSGRPHLLGLACGQFLCMLLCLVVIGCYGLLRETSGFETQLLEPVVSAVEQTVVAVLLMPQLTFLALGYRHLMRQQPTLPG